MLFAFQCFPFFSHFFTSMGKCSNVAHCALQKIKCSEKHDKSSVDINPFCDLFNSFVFLTPRILNDGVDTILPKAVRGNKILIVDQNNGSLCCWGSGLDHF